MFNNPFDSFHNTVAEAKADREQLDRLLTISTPGEHLLILLVLILLVALSAWITLLEFDRNISADGTVIEQSLTHDGAGQIVRLDVWLSSELSPKISVGMPLMIKFVKYEGKVETVRGVIRSIQALNFSQDLIIAGLAPLTANRFEIAVRPETNLTPFVGQECSAIIQLGRQSLSSLFREHLF